MNLFEFSLLFKLFLIYITLPICLTVNGFEYDKAELESDYWNKLSENALRDALKQKPIHKMAKNVVIFLGDGMGITTITSARILKGQLVNKSGEESVLSFDKFPYISLIKTYNVDYQVPDSAGTATAYLCGVKTNLGVLGVNAHVSRNESNCNIIEKNSVSSIMQWAIDSGKSTGIVTTTRITHATPGAAYARIANRDWEAFMPSNTSGNCKDIALQLIQDEPGSKLKVILGGGRRGFLPNTEIDPSNEYGHRIDGRNLIQEWIDRKKEQTHSKVDAYKYVDNAFTLRQVNFDETEYLFGLFNSTNMAYEMERNRSPTGEPSLEEMTESAIKVLSKDPNGFVLLVEGGRIDHAHHDNYAVHSLYETLAFDKAIEKAVSMLPQSETLMVVTADHSHALSINGEPKRGNSIFGIAFNDSESKPYTTLMYGTGPGYQLNRNNPNNTADLRYQQLAAVHLVESHHGGEDVAVYSVGPMSHLFVGTQEQSYIAHVMAFAACIGRYSNEDHCVSLLSSSSESIILSNRLLTNLCIIIYIILVLKNLF